MTAAFTIAPATPADAPEIAAIYAHHVLNGVATFETVPPSVEEIAARIGRVLDAGHPWLAARGIADDVLGYAYAGPFHARAAYRFTCEDSIYLRHDRLGQGIGSALLAALLEAAAGCGYRQMVALIAGSEDASIALHARAGFVEAGRLGSVGRKFGRWIDVIHMQRALGAGDGTPPLEEPL